MYSAAAIGFWPDDLVQAVAQRLGGAYSQKLGVVELL